MFKLSGKVNRQLTALNPVETISGLVPQILEEMETLKKATVTPNKPKVSNYCRDWGRGIYCAF